MKRLVIETVLFFTLWAGLSFAATVGNTPNTGGAQQVDGTWLLGLAGGQNQSRQLNLVATPGGGQANALRLLPNFNLYQLDTVASLGDSVALMPCNAPFQFTVVNNGVNSANVFAARGTTDTINGIIGTSPVGIASLTATLFVCVENGKWFTVTGGTGGSGGVLNVTDNGVGTLTISPTTGNVVIGCTIATGAQVGCVRPDNQTLVVSGGVLSILGTTVSSIADNGLGTLNFSSSTGAVAAGCTTATIGQVGCIRPDGTTVSITMGGVISVIGQPAIIIANNTPAVGFVNGDLIGISNATVTDTNFQFSAIGTVQNVNAGCSNFIQPGSGIIVSGTISTQIIYDFQSAATFNIPLSDCGNAVYSGITASSTYTLPTGTASTGWYTWAKNATSSTANLIVSCGANCSIGSGSVTSTVIGPGQSTLFFFAGGTQWLKVASLVGEGGTVSSQSGTSYTFIPNDCGTSVRFTSNSAVTATITTNLPLGCSINVIQRGTAKVTISGSGISVTNDQSFTGTSGTAGSFVNLLLDTTTTAILSGHGS